MKNIILLAIIILSTVSCTKTGRNNRRSHLRTTTHAKHSTIQPIAKPIAPQNKQTAIMSPTEIFERYNSAVFMIFTTDGFNQYQGSGFFISSDGLAVSNYHVFKGTTVGQEIIKLSDGRAFRIKKIISQNEKNDFILFQIEGKFNFIPISRRNCRIGEKVYAIGSPLGLENTFSSGEISQIRDNHYIQINCPIDHGSSGGVLINSYGEAIGITTGGHDDSNANLNFAKDIHVIFNALKFSD